MPKLLEVADAASNGILTADRVSQLRQADKDLELLEKAYAQMAEESNEKPVMGRKLSYINAICQLTVAKVHAVVVSRSTVASMVEQGLDELAIAFVDNQATQSQRLFSQNLIYILGLVHGMTVVFTKVGKDYEEKTDEWLSIMTSFKQYDKNCKETAAEAEEVLANCQ